MRSEIWGMLLPLWETIMPHTGRRENLFLIAPNSEWNKNIDTFAAKFIALLVIGLIAAVILLIYREIGLRRENRETRAFFRETFSFYGIIVWAVHPVKGTLYFSSLARKLTGLTGKEVLGQLPHQTRLRETGHGRLVDLMEEALSGQLPEGEVRGVLSLMDPSGSKHDFEVRFSIMPNKEKAPGIYILTGVDVTERNRYEERLHLAHEGSGAIIWEADMAAGTYIFSKRWNELMGYEEREEPYSEAEIQSLIHPEDLEQAWNNRLEHLKGDNSAYNAEYRMRTRTGEYRWMQARGKVLRDADGTGTRFAGSLIDITDRKKYELQLKTSFDELEHTNRELASMQEELKQQVNLLVESQNQLRQNEDKLQKLAYFDPVSGLPNRVYLLEMLESYLAEPDQKAALLFIDADNFKNINDTYGHKWGDLLIREAGARLNAIMPAGAMLFRFGGDEFVMLVKETTSPAGLQNLARRLIKAFKTPFEAAQGELHLSISIGMAFYPEQAHNPEELIKNADVALYHAQKTGKGSYAVYDASMQRELHSRMRLETELLSALDHDEFELYYQPQINAVTGKICGFEALLRWENPVLGRVPPDKFIQVAEESRLIIPIGEWVLLNACGFLKSLHNAGYEGYKISVNISVIQLKQEGFVHNLADILEEVNLSPEFLEIEITESLFMESGERSSLIAKLDQIRQMGIGIAMDDFGTGYSSLGYLRELPITILKMDKKFVDPIENDITSRSLASAILLIGHSLGLQIVAEGVETDAQFLFLKTHGCDLIQGYLFSRPLPESEIAGLLSNWTAR